MISTKDTLDILIELKCDIEKGNNTNMDYKYAYINAICQAITAVKHEARIKNILSKRDD